MDYKKGLLQNNEQQRRQDTPREVLAHKQGMGSKQICSCTCDAMSDKVLKDHMSK